ncbi:MAG: MBL fold metallo-hydrolase [Pseudomonadota bacterium]
MKEKSISRRAYLKLQALAAGGLALTGCDSFRGASTGGGAVKESDPAQRNTLFDELPTHAPGEKLGEDEMRISFMGTSCLPRLTQQGVSVYVEVGWDKENKRPLDYAMFDCGMGVLANYIAMDIPYSRMDKIFLSHLHADHVSELSAIYCFGESIDRKSPMYVWGPSASGVPDPVTGELHNDGTRASMEHFRELWRWHTEAFSFTHNGYAAYQYPTKESWGTPVDLTPVGPKYQVDQAGRPVGEHYADPPNDSYALVPIELDWREVGGVAYHNKTTGLKISHFPAVHCRRGSVSYKVEWTPPGKSEAISMIYSGDTKPTYTMVDQAKGVDVLIHEMVVPPEVWARKIARLHRLVPIPDRIINYVTDVQNSSHTTQGAFGYLLSRINPRPRLTIATHFQAQDDTIESASESLDRYKIPREAYTFATDLMVFNVTKEAIKQRRAAVSRFAFAAPFKMYAEPHNPPKYRKDDGKGDPNAQIDNAAWIPFGPDAYNEDGY